MQYIDLDAINEEHICGDWEIITRGGNILPGTDLFADIRIMELRPQRYRSVNGKERFGAWTVVREDAIIYNPQLKFFIDGEEVGNAIITRLRLEPSKEGMIHKLTLYFITGLELILCKRTA